MNWIGLVPLGLGSTMLATAGVSAGVIPPGTPLAGVALAGTGAVVASVKRNRVATKVDDLEGFRAKLEKTLGEPTSLRVLKKDRHAPLRIAVTYPAMFDDTIANQLKVADLVNRRLPGRWDSEWDTVGNRFEAWRRPDMPDKVDRPLKPDTARFPLGVTEAHKPAAWVPAVMPHALVVGATGAGKALALDTPVPTANAGWQTMGSLQRGDILFDEQGRPCTITHAHPVLLGEPCYRITFSDGTQVVADAGHLWEAESRRNRETETRLRTRGVRSPLPQSQVSQVVTTCEMAGSVMTGAWRNWSIRTVQPLEYPERDLPVDPYVFGVWLGDGRASCAEITTADTEIVDEFTRAGFPTRPVGKASQPYQYRVGGDLNTRLRALGVIGDKHIPRIYLEASPAQRLALLQGLMDSDGTVSRKTGGVAFEVTSEVLARQVHRLVGTLGMKSTLTSRPATYAGRDCGTRWAVRWVANTPVFRLSRKLELQKVDPRITGRRRYITSIEPVESVPVRCVTVDSPNHLFVITDACIPTHNSVLISGLIMHAAASGWEVRIVDGKGTTLAGFRNWPGVTMCGFGDAEDMQPVLTRTEREVRDRYRRVRAGEIEVEDLHPILLVIDEGAEMTQSLQTWWADNKPPKGGSKPPGMNAWRSVARLGREARVHLVFGIQQAAASFFEGTEARSNFSCRVALGPTESTSAEMTFGQSWVGRDVPVTAKGRATWTTGDEGRFAEIQTYYSPELRPTGRPRNEADADAVRRWYAAARQAWPEGSGTVGDPGPEPPALLPREPAPELEVAAETPSEVRETPAVPPPTEGASSPSDGKPRCRECERPVKARGLCTKHYHRARRAGEFTTTREEAHG